MSSSENSQDEFVTRGVRNPRVVDLIRHDTASDEVVLALIEDRPWASEEEQLSQLEEKFNNYIDYILDGWFEKQYPQFAGKQRVIELRCVEAPDKREAMYIEAMTRFCASSQIKFNVVVEEISSLNALKQ